MRQDDRIAKPISRENSQKVFTQHPLDKDEKMFRGNGPTATQQGVTQNNMGPKEMSAMPRAMTLSGAQRRRLQATMAEHEKQIIQTMITARDKAQVTRGIQGTGGESTEEGLHTR